MSAQHLRLEGPVLAARDGQASVEPRAPAAGTPFLSSGNPLPEDEGERYPTQPTSVVTVPQPRRPRVISGETFLQESEAQPHGWWWDRIIPLKGITLFAGDPVSFKSVLLLTASVVARNGGLLGGRMVRQARVLYVKLEHLDSTYRDVLRRAERTYHPVDLNNFHLLKELDLENPVSVAAVEDWAEDIGAEVIIIDSLRRAHLGEENSSKDTALNMRALQRLTSDGRRAVIAVHHLTRSTRQLRGSTDHLAGADGEVRVTREEDNIVRLQGRSHGGDDLDVRVRVSFAGDTLTVDPAEEPSRGTSGGQALREAVIRACTPGPMTTTGLREAVRGLLGRAQSDRVDAMALELERDGRLRNQPGRRGNGWVATMPEGGASPLPRAP